MCLTKAIIVIIAIIIIQLYFRPQWVHRKDNTKIVYIKSLRSTKQMSHNSSSLSDKSSNSIMSISPSSRSPFSSRHIDKRRWHDKSTRPHRFQQSLLCIHPSMTIVVRIRFLPNGFGGSVQGSAVVPALNVRFQSYLRVRKASPITLIPGGELLILAEHIAKQRRTDDVYRRLLTVSVSDT